MAFKFLLSSEIVNGTSSIASGLEGGGGCAKIRNCCEPRIFSATLYRIVGFYTGCPKKLYLILRLNFWDSALLMTKMLVSFYSRDIQKCGS